MFKRISHVYHEEADAGASAGGSSAAGAASAQAAGGDATAQAGSAADGKPAGTAADTGSGAQAAQAGSDENVLAAAKGVAPAPGDKVPEQLRVMKADGTLDVEATLAKQADSYNALAQRMRETGAPPKDAAEYTVTVPESLAGKWSPDTDEGVVSFRSKAHELGLTQKQFDGVMGEYLGRVGSLVDQTSAQQANNATAELQKHWKTAESFKAGQVNAFKAVQNVMGEETDAVVQALGNNPLFLRFAAKVGAEMREDVSPGGNSGAGAQFAGQTKEQLMSHPAYTDPKHPDHKTVSALIKRHYEVQHGTTELV